ncbi:hypothetical protein HELRODRAFT_194755 [Helobdella robusta]|uniref:Solute carrier family 12 member 6 n=1 Tax=Helobdella robusta TaxID=6412 RepID=T1FWD4_HELRO|nr:hypothetical protein HELRODRAFT_194755 [Helobdella robusta]ESN89907.1 hypothetical protein HELRODRAFT_194755 [Helobdella robusta]
MEKKSSVRFSVHKAEEPASTDAASTATTAATSNNFVKKQTSFSTKVQDEHQPKAPIRMYQISESETPEHNQRALYEDDTGKNAFVTEVIQNLVHRDVEEDGGDDAGAGDDDIEAAKALKKPAKCFKFGKKAALKKKNAKKLGTVLGVFFPCVQNIFGVILFIRLVWVADKQNKRKKFQTLTTSISMSAIATNGEVSGGGVYFMISRALGPEFGGAVGILFYLGTTVASSMYTVGAVEILLQYMAPNMAIFGPVTDPSSAYNSYRVYGSALLFIKFLCVFVGVKFVSKLSPVVLFCVLFSILCVYIGIFVANPERGPQVCFVGDRLLALKKIKNVTTEEVRCDKSRDGFIYAMYCDSPEYEDNDDWCKYLNQSTVEMRPGIPGLASGVFLRNIWSHFSEEEGTRIGSKVKGDRNRGDIVTDIATSFVVLIGIFFPSVTGIMAGSNRSGDLADAQKSIPVGTISAVLATSFVYISCMLLFTATIEGQFLRDKFGESMGGGLIVAHLSWPNPWVIMVGSFLSTCGAGLQSLVGAPRLLQAIASDGILPFLNPFAVLNNGEPKRALLLTGFIAECGVLLANVDYIAPIITMFFLMCYCFTNMACALQTILKIPSWRPRFKYYHWSLSLFGVLLCLTLMFMSSWYFALVAIALAAFLYKYIEYKGAEKEWGDGLTGLSMSAARFALLRLEDNDPHVKNWRPQLLVLCTVDEKYQPKYPNLIEFAAQLKAGKGLTMLVTVVEGSCGVDCSKAAEVKNSLKNFMKVSKIKGFVDVILAEDVPKCLTYVVQGAGLGTLRHNTVLMNFPSKWRENITANRKFIDLIRLINNKNLALLVTRNIEQFPNSSTPKFKGTIDVWWVVHDGGLLMLLPFLLMQHKVWKNCKMRIFTVAEMQDNSVQIKKDVETFLYKLRMNAEVQVIELHSQDISAYAYERTLIMEQRSEMLKQIKSDASAHIDPQQIIDLNRKQDFLKVPEITASKETAMDGTQYTYSSSSAHLLKDMLINQKPKSKNVRKMHSAVRLNENIKEKSSMAKLIILNLPPPPKHQSGEENYMDYIEVLTDGLNQLVMIRGSGKEVITIYS